MTALAREEVSVMASLQQHRFSLGLVGGLLSLLAMLLAGCAAKSPLTVRLFWKLIRRFGLTVRPFFLEFRKFQLIESLELMRFSHFWGKLAANLPPRLQTADEARLSVQLVNSLETKLPNLRISFQNKRTVSSPC